MPFLNREDLAQQLAETYTGGRTVDAWQQVQEYREYLDYTARHPNAGRTKTGNALEIPPGRVRAWNNGSKPDAVKAIDIAEERNWLDASETNDAFCGLVILTAWIYAGGSISEDTHTPYFAVDKDSHLQAKAALAAIGDSNPQVNRTEEPGRATEVRPHENGSALGRMLSVLGAPVGQKAHQHLSLPDWLDQAPEELRLAFAQTYVWNRGTELSDRPNTPIQIREERDEQYIHELKQFFDSVIADATTTGDKTFRLTSNAAAILYRPPQI